MTALVGDILLTILAPILLLIGVGALLRWKLRIDVATLARVNIYVLVPAFVFDNVSNSRLSVADMLGVFGITVLQVLILGLVVWGIGRLLRISRQTLAAIALAVMFYNSGNYGIPLAELAYPKQSPESKVLSPAPPTINYQLRTTNSSSQDSALSTQDSLPDRDGATYQTFVMMAQSLLTFTVGMAIAAIAHTGGVGKGLVKLARLPIIPSLLAAVAAQWWLKSDPAHHLPIFITKTAQYLRDAMPPVALMTLGAQLATNPRWPRWKPVSMVLLLRLVFGPIQMLLMLWALHLTGIKALNVWPWPAELLILTASVPSAVNTLLLTLELGGDTELAADCVFWTTLFSVLTITLWLIFLRTVPWQTM